MTEGFYQDSQTVFESPIDYEWIDPVPEPPRGGSVNFAPFLRSTAAAMTTAVVIFANAIAFTSPATIDSRVFVSAQRPFPTVPVPLAHQRMAGRVKGLFKAIPLSPSEAIADPDYDL